MVVLLVGGEEEEEEEGVAAMEGAMVRISTVLLGLLCCFLWLTGIDGLYDLRLGNGRLRVVWRV